MNDSKSSASSRVIRDPSLTNSGLSLVTPTNAAGHTNITSTNPFSTYIANRKPNPSSTGTVTNLQPISVTAIPVNAQYQVPLITCLNKNPLTVVTTFATKPSTSGAPTVEKHSLTGISNSASDSLTRATVKPIGVQKGSYGKPPSAPTLTQGKTLAMSVAESSPTQPGIAIAQMKKEPVKPVLIGAGLRQPSKNPHFHSQISKSAVTVTEPTNIPRNQPNNSNSWVVHQHDSYKPSSTSTVTASVQRKPPVMLRSVFHPDNTTGVQSPQSTTTPLLQEPGKKLSGVLHQPKTTFSISMPSLSHIAEGQKSVYQLISPTFPSQSTAVKKIQTMIVTPVSNSGAVTTGFPLPTNTVFSAGQITVMTCGYGMTNVPAPTPPSVSNTSIPVAKVYPQQQLTTPVARLSATSTSSRLSIPVATSTLSNVTNTVIPHSTSSVIQPGTVKATSATSTVMVTPTTIVSTLPISGSRAVANPTGLNQVLRWSNIFPTYTAHALPVVPSTAAMANLRPGLTLTNSQSHQSLSTPSTIRVQHPGVVVVENPRPLTIQPSGTSNTSILQVPDGSNRNVPVSNSSGSAVGPTTPTMSPKPAILRRQRPDNSSALKKLSFPTSSLALNQRRDHVTAQLKTGDKRSSSGPYHPSNAKISNTGNSMKTNDVAVMIRSNDNKEMKPVLPNQVYGKQIIANNGFPSLKVNNFKANVPLPVGGGNKESNTQSYSIHPVNIDMKVKVEPGVASYNQSTQVKTDSAAASQVFLPYPHLFPAEAPQPVKHRIVTQASGQHIKTNTIFASPGSFIPQHHMGQTNGRAKPTKHHVIPESGTQYSIQADASVMQNNYTGSSINSFVYSTHSIQQADTITVNRKDKPSHLKSQSIKTDRQGENVTVTNHYQEMGKITESPSRLWSQMKDSESMVGLSPRKRPRKQTHIVSDVPADVEMMVDEESTDDADEWEDETDNTSNINYQENEVSGTQSSRLPGNKSSLASHSVKSETSTTDKKAAKEEKSSYHLSFKPDSSTSHENGIKTLTEFIDSNGVRYVATKKRLPVAVLNKLKPNGRSISNHFMHYSDVKVRDKKLTPSDFVADRKRFKGMKVAMFALQLKQLVLCEEDVWKRMESVYNGLVKHKQTFLEDTAAVISLDESMRQSTIAMPSPCTPTSNTFSKALLTPTSIKSTVPSTITENGLTPTTPSDRRVHKIKDDIIKIEELAQANIQRCKVVSDQTKDTKTMLLKVIDHRQLAWSILDGSTGHKSVMVAGPSNPLKRVTKKKNIS